MYGSEVAEPKAKSLVLPNWLNVTPPSMETWNVTVPVAKDGVTVATAVTDWPIVIVGGERLTLVVEDPMLIAIVCIVEVEGVQVSFCLVAPGK